MSIKKNFAFNTVYQILNLLIPLITTPYISRVLGAEGVGRYSYAYSVAAYFVMFAMLGLNNYGIRSIGQVRDDQKRLNRTFTSIYLLQLMTSFLIAVAYFLYIACICEDKTIGLIMAIYVISPLIDLNWLFHGLEQFKLTAIRGILVRLFCLVCIFCFVKSREDVYIYTFIYVSSIIIGQIIMFVQTKRFVRMVKVTFKDVIFHLKPNLTLFIPVIAISLYKYMDKIMLGVLCQKVDVGYYESCEKILSVPSALVVSLGTVMLPRISNLMAKNKSEQAMAYLQKSIIFASVTSLAVSFGVIAISEEFVPLYYGIEFLPCIQILAILMPSSFFVSVANVLRTQYLIPGKKDKIYIISVLAGATVNLILNLALIPSWQARGAAVGTLIAEFTVCLLQFLLVHKEIKVWENIKYILPFLADALLMVVLLKIIPLNMGSLIMNMLVKIMIGAVVYSTIALGVLWTYRKRKVI